MSVSLTLLMLMHTVAIAAFVGLIVVLCVLPGRTEAATRRARDERRMLQWRREHIAALRSVYRGRPVAGASGVYSA